MHPIEHNRLTSAFIQRRRSLERLHFRHDFKARTYQDGSGQHRRMAERYRDELVKMGGFRHAC